MVKRLRLISTAKRVGVVTRPYPFKPIEVPEEFRGKPIIDGEKCTGCGSCRNACTPNAIEIEDDLEKGVRRVKIFYGRCIFCGRCSDICPEEAIKLTKEFELASKTHEDLYQVIELKMIKCKICGKPFTTKRSLEKTLESVPEELHEQLYICPDCREKSTAYIESYTKRR